MNKLVFVINIIYCVYIVLSALYEMAMGAIAPDYSQLQITALHIQEKLFSRQCKAVIYSQRLRSLAGPVTLCSK